jgi:hypothetical protein
MSDLRPEIPADAPPGSAKVEPASSDKGHHASTTGLVPPAPAALDLHTHTLRSDGILTPQELVTAVAATGVRLLAITDHDSRSSRGSRSTPSSWTATTSRRARCTSWGWE